MGIKNGWGCILAFLLAPLWIPVVVVAVLIQTVLAVCLLCGMWLIGCSRGQYVLFVHSNSPVWEEYLAQHILPQIPENATLLNWSERAKWKGSSFSVRVFRFFGGDREFNPMGLVCNPFRPFKTFRFWKPFRDFKHGNPDALQKMEADFVAELKK